MAIRCYLKDVLKEKGITSRELARTIPITEANLSHLVTGKARAVRIDLLNALCEELDCQPGDILRYVDD